MKQRLTLLVKENEDLIMELIDDKLYSRMTGIADREVNDRLKDLEWMMHDVDRIMEFEIENKNEYNRLLKYRLSLQSEYFSYLDPDWVNKNLPL